MAGSVSAAAAAKYRRKAKASLSTAWRKAAPAKWRNQHRKNGEKHHRRQKRNEKWRHGGNGENEGESNKVSVSKNVWRHRKSAAWRRAIAGAGEISA